MAKTVSDDAEEWSDDFDADTARRCFHCSGEGWVECWDPIQCCCPHVGALCQCGSCNGSGLAKDMTIW
jgi:hypothetical protein